ncbi:MAG: hypothetical protein WA160_00950 [Pseudobdellovibrio sp.]
MKNCETPWSVGSLFICNKCGIAFNQPDNAENLKKALRLDLKEKESGKKNRVMVSGCLSICDKTAQAVMYHPIEGKTQVFTTAIKFEDALNEIKTFLDQKNKH